MATASSRSSPPTETKTKESETHHGLLSYDEIPLWYQDNDCIRHGYRPVMNNAKTCIESWTYLHNETVNVYSHLLPALLAILSQGFMYKSFWWKYPQATTRDYLMVAFHLCTVSVCFGISAFYHTLISHSARLSDLWVHIDYIGIIILTFGDFVSGIYVAFYCEPILQNTYWAMVCSKPCDLPQFLPFPQKMSLTIKLSPD